MRVRFGVPRLAYHQLTPPSRSCSISSKLRVNVPADRYVQPPSGTIVALLPDGGWKYLSAGTFTRSFDEMEQDLEGGVNWW